MPDEIVPSVVATGAPPAPSPSQPIGEVSGSGVEQSAALPPPPPPPLDPVYLAKGQRWKMSEEDLRQVPQHIYDRLQAAAENEILESLAMADASAGVDPASRSAPPAAAPTAPALPADSPFAPLTLTFEDDGEEPGPYRKHIESVVGWANHAVQELVKKHEAEMSQVKAAFAQISDTAAFNELDHYIASWGDEWSDVFGKGPTIVLDAKSQEYQHRGELLKAARRSIELDRRLGRPVNVSDAVLRARAQRFSDKQAVITRTAQEKRLKEVQAQLPPATNRMGAYAGAGANGSVKTSDADCLRRFRGG